MTDQMKWALVGIAGFLAVGVVATLLIVAVRTNPSVGAQGASTPANVAVPTSEAVVAFPTTSTVQLDVGASTTKVLLATTTTEQRVNWHGLRGRYIAGRENYFDELGYPQLSDIRFTDDDGNLRPLEVRVQEVKMSTSLLAAGWVFAALDPGSEAYTTYYESIRAEDAVVADLIEAAATANLDPIWTEGIVEHCFANDPWAYLMTTGQYELTTDPVGDIDWFDNYHEITSTCITTVVTDNFVASYRQ